MKTIKLIIAILISFQAITLAQSVKGTVKAGFGKGAETLPGANIYWKNELKGTTTDVNGKFELAFPANLPDILIISSAGFIGDSISFRIASDTTISVSLKSATLKEVVVNEHADRVSISTINPINVQTITTGELRKAACCNLSESFETNASVDVSYTDAVSGAKQIQMLGLDGIYTQILSENVPLIRGLSSSYGLSYTPGTWIQSIAVTKGAGSVVNGYESITGQLQIELIEPVEAEKVMLNTYVNSDARYEGNVHLGYKLSKNVSSVLLAHYSAQSMAVDRNHDSFLDMPMTNQANVMNRWTVEKQNKYCIQLGLRVLSEDREGGQIPETKHENIPGHYSINIKNRQAEFFSKTGFMFPQPYKSLGIITSLRVHERSSLFGVRTYEGSQKSFYLNSIYETIIHDTRHKIRTGASVMADDYQETFSGNDLSHYEFVPGVFGEYTYSDADKFSVVAGMRVDNHNEFGLFYTPRVHFKYNIAKKTIFRLSAGKGHRTANVLVENNQVFASSRVVVINEKFRPEEAVNAGLTLTQKYKIKAREGSVNLDVYRTEFINQVVTDLETPGRVEFYNLDGKSYSNSYQLEMNQEIIEGLDLRVAGKIYDVKTQYKSGVRSKPLVARERALMNISYATKFEKWKFDLTSRWTGRSRIPTTAGNPAAYQLSETSPSYFYHSAQITRGFKHFQVYLGVENITNFTQKSPILAASEPYGPYFDASLIWGPVSERMVYTGFRYSIK
jgi:outer membrane receptor for ferrienterochelin and colicins